MIPAAAHSRPSTVLVDDARLDEMRQLGDRLGDEAVGELAAARPRRGGVLEDVAWRARQEDGACRTLWERVHRTPRWADFQRMLPSASMALQHVIPGGMALMAASLVESYAAARGAKVLVRTGRLERDTLRRLWETARFTSDIATCLGARPGTDAFDNVLKVRLIHAWVRRGMIMRPDWQREAWGLPVNQEDYAWTLMMFSHVYRRAMITLGVSMSPEERSSNHLTWRHVGWLMGVHEDLLTETPAEEEELYLQIAHRQARPDDDSRLLAHQLLRCMAGEPPFYLPTGALYATSRLLVGDQLADAFEFPRAPFWERVVRSASWPLALRRGLLRRVPGAGRAAERVGRGLAVVLLRQGLGREPADFEQRPES